jgi:hypothetical protein
VDNIEAEKYLKAVIARRVAEYSGAEYEAVVERCRLLLALSYVSDTLEELALLRSRNERLIAHYHQCGTEIACELEKLGK